MLPCNEMDASQAAERDLEVEEGDGFLQVRFLGSFSVDRFKRQADAAAKACRERKRANVLVDLSCFGAQISTLERFEIASRAVRVAGGLRAALVVAPGFLDPGKFGVMVARNRGLAVDAFLDRQKALDWLVAGA